MLTECVEIIRRYLFSVPEKKVHYTTVLTERFMEMTEAESKKDLGT